MPEPAYHGLLISDFTIDNLSGLLSNDEGTPKVTASVAPFGQVIPALLDGGLPCWQPQPDFAVVWTRPEAVIKGFGRVLEFNRVEVDELLAEVDEYASAIAKISDRVRFAFVPTWVMPAYHRGWGMLERQNSVGMTDILLRMNQRLSDQLDDIPNIYLPDTQRWVSQIGKRAFNPKLWYMGKVAFSSDLFILAVRDIKAAINGLVGSARKLVLVDLDDTLWGGIVGEIGYENLRLGGHDPIGEAYADFQKTLKSLTNRGILLGIVSKNDENIALEAFKNHPEMVLIPDDFAGWRIDWQDKAQNIVELTKELNLGLQSVVFIDDNPVERDRVRVALPEVFVPDWPSDPMLYVSTLLSLDCFDTGTVTTEDVRRTEMYVAERKRQDIMYAVGSIDDWLRELDIRVNVEELTAVNKERTVQLLNKTNQMNMSTRRLTERELTEWATQPNHKLWIFRVADKFGDSGLTGIVSCEVSGCTAKIIDFVLSCRVIGRRVEETMLHTVVSYASSLSLQKTLAKPLPTDRNMPCLEFFKQSGFLWDKETGVYKWSCNKEYPLPACVTLLK